MKPRKSPGPMVRCAPRTSSATTPILSCSTGAGLMPAARKPRRRTCVATCLRPWPKSPEPARGRRNRFRAWDVPSSGRARRPEQGVFYACIDRFLLRLRALPSMICRWVKSTVAPRPHLVENGALDPTRPDPPPSLNKGLLRRIQRCRLRGKVRRPRQAG